MPTSSGSIIATTSTRSWSTLIRALNPVLTLIDGITAMEGLGPLGGDPLTMNLITASADPLAVDATTARIMGFDPYEIDHFRIAYQQGVGVMYRNEIDVVGEPIERVRREFRKPDGRGRRFRDLPACPSALGLARCPRSGRLAWTRARAGRGTQRRWRLRGPLPRPARQPGAAPAAAVRARAGKPAWPLRRERATAAVPSARCGLARRRSSQGPIGWWLRRDCREMLRRRRSRTCLRRPRVLPATRVRVPRGRCA